MTVQSPPSVIVYCPKKYASTYIAQKRPVDAIQPNRKVNITILIIRFLETHTGLPCFEKHLQSKYI
jgi:hypothetical protein